MKFEIWAEGYQCTGNESKAFLVGKANSNSLKNACIKYSKTHEDFKKLFDEKELTYWGCRLFDNQKDAQKSFG